MERIGMAAGANPPNKNKQNSFVHTAVLEGIAVFFCSTGFCLFPSRFLISGKNHQFRAPALPWVRFSFVEKWNCLRCLRPYQCDKSLLPHCRGPPIGLDFSKKFRMIGGTQRGC